MIKFTVEGRPVPKARPVIPKHGHPYTRKSTLEYERRVAEAYEKSGCRAYMENEALTADIRFYFKIPKSTTKKEKAALLDSPWYFKKVDLDNLAKSVLDGLNGRAYGDDSQIVSLYISKSYDIRELGERAEITIKVV